MRYYRTVVLGQKEWSSKSYKIGGFQSYGYMKIVVLFFSIAAILLHCYKPFFRAQLLYI